MNRAWGGDDTGSALVEFCVLGVLLLVPIVYLVVALGRLEAGAFAAQRAAREAARVYVTAPDDATGASRAAAAVTLALADHGLTDAERSVDVDCGLSDCHAPDTRVHVRVAVDVRLPAVPRVLDRAIPLHVEVSAHQVATVDRFGAR